MAVRIEAVAVTGQRAAADAQQQVSKGAAGGHKQSTGEASAHPVVGSKKDKEKQRKKRQRAERKMKKVQALAAAHEEQAMEPEEREAAAIDEADTADHEEQAVEPKKREAAAIDEADTAASVAVETVLRLRPD